MLYIFDYGGPILVISFSDNQAKIFRKFNDDNIINGMATVAGLLHRVKDTKFFAISRFVGYLGKHFIGVGFVNDIKYRVFIIGFLKRLISEIDSIGVSIIDLIVEKTINHLKREIRIKSVEIIE